MKNTLESVGTEAAGEILAWVKSAKEMLQEQAPLLVAEALEYELQTSWIWLYVGVFMIAVGLIYAIYYLFSERYDGGTSLIALFLGCFPGIIVVVAQVADIIKVTVAPRMYIIEFLSGLVKQQ